MDTDTVVGVIALIVSVVTMVGLTLWSRGRINRIAEKEATSARELLKELRDGR